MLQGVAKRQFILSLISNVFNPIRDYVLCSKEEYEELINQRRGGELVHPVTEERIRYKGDQLSLPSCFATIRLKRELYVGEFDENRGRELLVAYVNIFSVQTYRVTLSYFPFDIVIMNPYLGGHVIDLRRADRDSEIWISVDERGWPTNRNEFRLF